jgi:nucleoside-diphosphate-sugar epimerase
MYRILRTLDSRASPNYHERAMRVILIGGTKFIGPHVVRQLVDAGHSVCVYHRGEHESLLPPEVRHIHHPTAAMPITEFADQLLASISDVVIHMIPMGKADSRAAVQAFRYRTQRLVALSSGDVYRAYGRLTGLEPGPAEKCPLTEESPLREVRYPYRRNAKSTNDLLNSYEKIAVEGEVLGDRALPGVVLRLPKVYGPGENDDLKTMYAYSKHPQWRWTHGYVENVAHAIVLAATSPTAASRIYNIGEEQTPTIAQRLAKLPVSIIPPEEGSALNFDQDIVYDTNRIRSELGYREIVSYEEGLKRTLEANRAAKALENREIAR